MLSFSNKKELRFVITLGGDGTFGSTGANVVTLQGFRATVDIDRAGGVQMSTLRAKIYGVRQQDMNSITTLQWKVDVALINTVEVFAIDGTVETLVFAGNIVQAWADYAGTPDVFLHIQAAAARFNGLKSVPPRSFKGAVDVAGIMGQIAASMGYVFENNGVTTQLSDVYLANTGLEQAKDLARMAGCNMYIDDKVLAITPPNVPRGSLIPVISPATGLIGYPTFDGVGIMCRILFNPSVIHGGLIRIQSDADLSKAGNPAIRAEGEWIVTSVAHRLESEKPGGAWFSTIRGNTSGLAITR